jgi:hypothetical protein
MRARKFLFAIGLGAVALSALVYAGDYAAFAVRVKMNRRPYGAVTVQRYDAVLKKNGKTQFIFDPPQLETCVNSLFSHQGFAPCWYLSRHTQQETTI